MSNWIPKNKIIKFAATAALLSIILYFGGLFTILGKLKEVENLYNGAESEFTKEKKFLAVKSVAETNKDTIETLRNFFIRKGDEVKFIEQIEEIARESAVKFEIISIDVKTNQADSFMEDVSVRMSIESSWKNIMSFINKLEGSSFGVSIENINLDASVSGYWSGFVEFIIFREK